MLKISLKGYIISLKETLLSILFYEEVLSMHKFISIIMILFLLCGCSKSTTVQNTQTHESIKKSTPKNNSATNKAENKYNYISWDDFNEDRAWIRMNSYTHIGCIDKKGYLLFEYENMDILTDFSNGYAHVKDQNTDIVYVLDSSGNIQSAYPEDSSTTVIAYGDGYTVTSEHAEGFNYNDYTYKIYDPSGSLINSFNTTDEYTYENSYYCGKDIFEFGNTNFYFISLKKMINCPTDHQVFFYDDTAAVDITYSETESLSKLKLMNTSGQISEIPIPKDFGSPYSSDIIIKDGLCLIQVSEYPEKNFISYDLSTNTFSKMNIDAKYADKINWDAIPEHFSFSNNRLVLPLTGDDDNHYIMVLDDNWNIIIQPVQGYSSEYTCQKLVVETNNDTVIYDKSGNILYTLSDKGYKKSDYQSDLTQKCPVPFSDNVMTFVIIGSHEPAYLDKNGNKLFSNINTNKSKLKTVNSYNSK